MNFTSRSTLRNWIASSRKATTAAGAAIYVEVDDGQGLVALTMRAAGVSGSAQFTADEAMAVAVELQRAAAMVSTATARLPLPDVRDSTWGEFNAARKA